MHLLVSSAVRLGAIRGTSCNGKLDDKERSKTSPPEQSGMDTEEPPSGLCPDIAVFNLLVGSRGDNAFLLHVGCSSGAHMHGFHCGAGTQVLYGSSHTDMVISGRHLVVLND